MYIQNNAPGVFLVFGRSEIRDQRSEAPACPEPELAAKRGGGCQVLLYSLAFSYANYCNCLYWSIILHIIAMYMYIHFLQTPSHTIFYMHITHYYPRCPIFPSRNSHGARARCTRCTRCTVLRFGKRTNWTA
jgi:hypothetical protein